MEQKKDAIDGIAQRLISVMPEFLTGNGEEMERRLKSAFGNLNFSEEIAAEKKKNALRWAAAICLLATLIAVILTQIFGAASENTISFERPDFLEQSVGVDAKVKVRFDTEEVVRNVHIVIRSKGLDQEEKERRVNETVSKLKTYVLGGNENLNKVNSDLNLIEWDEESLVRITWSTDRPEIIETDGTLNRVAAREGDFVNLTARLSLEDVGKNVAMPVRIGPLSIAGEADESLDMILKGDVKRLNESDDGLSLVLPESNVYGVEYTWETEKRNYHIMEIVALLMLMFLIYKSRYRGVNSRVSAARDSIVRDFPEFINKLLLLLNAGLVVSAAISRIAKEYDERRGEGWPRRHLYEELSAMQQRIEKTNASLAYELNVVASRSGVRELMRFSSIISDNIDKGSALADKLKAEGELVWNARRKKAEEAGRIAETKLVMPMMLILLVLILITVAPAALEM
ncbi:MAG: type II secretion system F family protein [Clostridiales Family XIII bacterium]|jgi:hypothetical protein|nr:type II secretion system F family protein [Clostridiales Family XIII bacterium]